VDPVPDTLLLKRSGSALSKNFKVFLQINVSGE
jgi:hypothetical protein